MESICLGTVAANWIDWLPIDELLYYDKPLIFTVICKRFGNPWLAYWCDCNGYLGEEQSDRYIVSPCDSVKLAAIRSGDIDLRTAISTPNAYLFEVTYHRPTKVWLERCYLIRDWEKLPETYRPESGITLLPEHCRKGAK